MRKWMMVFLLFAMATPASAQLTVPFTDFMTDTIINPDEVDANFAVLGNALNRTGGTMTGNLIFSPDNTLDIGAVGGNRARDFFLARNAFLRGNTTFGESGSFPTSFASSTGVWTINNGTLLGVSAVTVRGIKNWVDGTTASGNEDTASFGFRQTVATTATHAALGGRTETSATSGTIAGMVGTGGTVSLWSNVNVTNMRGVQADCLLEGGNGTVAECSGVLVNVPSRLGGTGTITNAYGVKISHGTTGLINRYGVYQETVGVVNGYAGRSVFGGLTATTAVSNLNAEIADGAYGTGNQPGSSAFIGGNTSGSQAAGTLGFRTRGGGDQWVWVDATGVVRIVGGFANRPEEDNTPSDTGGTVVGTQVSARAFKTDIRVNRDYDAMLRTVLRTPLYDFRYANGMFANDTFTGLMTDDSPVFGFDKDTDHPGGKSLNEVTAIGYLMGAIKALEARIAQLEAERDVR